MFVTDLKIFSTCDQMLWKTLLWHCFEQHFHNGLQTCTSAEEETSSSNASDMHSFRPCVTENLSGKFRAGRVSPIHSMNACEGLQRKLCARWSWMVRFMTKPNHSWEKSPRCSYYVRKLKCSFVKISGATLFIQGHDRLLKGKCCAYEWQQSRGTEGRMHTWSRCWDSTSDSLFSINRSIQIS